MAVIAVVQQLEKKKQGEKKKYALEAFVIRKKRKWKNNYFYKISRADEEDKPM